MHIIDFILTGKQYIFFPPVVVIWTSMCFWCVREISLLHIFLLGSVKWLNLEKQCSLSRECCFHPFSSLYMPFFKDISSKNWNDYNFHKMKYFELLSTHKSNLAHDCTHQSRPVSLAWKRLRSKDCIEWIQRWVASLPSPSKVSASAPVSLTEYSPGSIKSSCDCSKTDAFPIVPSSFLMCSAMLLRRNSTWRHMIHS